MDTALATRPGVNASIRLVEMGLGVLFVTVGVAKIVGLPAMVALFSEIGVGQWLRYAVGLSEAIGGVLLLVPRTTVVGALVLSGVMLGATLTNAMVLGISSALPSAILLVTTSVAWRRRGELLALAEATLGMGHAIVGARPSRRARTTAHGASQLPFDAREEHVRRALRTERARAEHLLNYVRATVLLLLVAAAVAYAPHIPPAVQRVNWLVLSPLLLWTLFQFARWGGDRRPPDWLGIVNPLVDVSAITAILCGYGVAESAALALKSPIFLVYFAILAARPITSSTGRAALVSAIVVLQYLAVVLFLLGTGHGTLTESPLTASVGPAVALLDEAAKLLLFVVAGGIATYATAWHERLARTYFRQAADHDRLEAELARAQLQSLKLQLSPHFLFNTLNGISALIGDDNVAAEKMLGGLSEFLRLTLYGSGAQEVALERELQLLSRYLDIQQIRFQERLRVNVDIVPDALHAMVPNLLLQPLAENAIKHGLAPLRRGGVLDVRASRLDGALVLSVSDNGAGQDRTASKRTQGIGLANTRARLAHLYGSAQRLDVQSAPGQGFTVTITIPYHTEAAASSPTGEYLREPARSGTASRTEAR